MSKYKKGDQFWFEITDVIEANDGKSMYECSNGGYAADEMLDGFERLDPDEKANADFDAGYAEGLREAWEAAKTAHQMADDKRERYIGYHLLGDVFDELTPAQVIEGVREYKEKQKAEQEIKVGDEVIKRLEKSTITFVLFAVSDDRIYGFTKDGLWVACYKKEVRKTGRHFSEIAEVMEAMKGDGDE